jgi:hypothetical protein
MWQNYILYVIGFVGIATYVGLTLDPKRLFWRRLWTLMSLWIGVYFTAWYVLAQYGVRK